MARTSCYEGLLDLGTKDADELSSALFCDARVVDSPHEAKTFWLPADARPTTNLEALAKAIFDFHSTSHEHLIPRQGPTDTRNCSVSGGAPGENVSGQNVVGNTRRSAVAHGKDGCDVCNKSGAEWWVQLREEGHHADLGMPFHWDKDENMVETHGVVVCPQVSTVTYLTDYGAPTVVLEVAATGKGVVEERDIERAFVSYPAPFKHLAFDGRFLHGVPEQLMRDKAHCSIQGEQHIIKEFEGASAKGDNNNERANDPSAFSPSSRLRWCQRGRVRVTLLVNIWMCHKPVGIEPLPEKIAASLTRRHRGPSVRSLLSFNRPVDFTPFLVNKHGEMPPQQQHGAGAIAGDTDRASAMLISVPLGPTILLEIRAPTPERLTAGGLASLHAFEMVSREGYHSRISIREKGGAGRATRATASPPLLAQSSSDGASAAGEDWRGSHGRNADVGEGRDDGLNGPRRKRKHENAV